MIIQKELFNPDLIYGRQSKQFLFLSPEGLKLSPTRAPGPLAINAYFMQHQEELSQNLKGRSLDALTTLATNLSYAVEKSKRKHISLLGGLIEKIYAASCLIVIYCVSDTLCKCLTIILLADTVVELFKRYCLSANPPRLSQNHQVIANFVFDAIIEASIRDLPDKVFTLTPEILARDLATRGYERANTDQMGYRLLFYTKRRSLKERLAFRHMLDVRHNLQKEGYFVVTHGQAIMGGIMVDLLTALTKKLEPSRSLQDFKVLRLALRSQQKQSSSHNLKKFFQEQGGFDIGLSDDLLSVSINPWDQSIFESALYFWWSNKNMDQDFAKILQESLRDQVVLKPNARIKIQETFERLQKIAKDADHSGGTLGQLYAIGIPRDLIENNCPLYPSLPYGILDCRKSAQIAHRVNTVWSADSPCQGRILTSMLLPELGIKIHAFNTHSPELRMKLNQAIQESAS